MDIVITQQEFDFFEKKLFADSVPRSLAASPFNLKLSQLVIEDDRSPLQDECVRAFEDGVADSVELREWFQRQRSKAFTYDEFVLQCVIAIECCESRVKRCKREWWLYACTEAYRLGVRSLPYTTFLKRVRDLETGRRIPVGEAI